MFQQAIKHLDEAIEGERAEFPMRIVDERANLKSCWAVKLKLDGTAKTGKPPEQLIQEAINDLDRLLKFNKSAERLCLLGSAYKRMAWIVPNPQRKESLAKMARYYREAHI